MQIGSYRTFNNTKKQTIQTTTKKRVKRVKKQGIQKRKTLEKTPTLQMPLVIKYERGNRKHTTTNNK